MSPLLNNSRVAVLGASRGLGAAIVQELLARNSGSAILGLARRPSAAAIQWLSADVSRPEEQERTLVNLADYTPDQVICTLGGGPFGPFHEKAWRDHQWSLEVSFLFPARLLHWALNLPENVRPKQIVVVGSSVAEDKPDPRAASYAASKHGLKGLISTIQAEHPPIDVRLYSPGYMNTDLLPPGAQARQQTLWEPLEVAKDLLDWMQTGPQFDHRCLAIRPGDR